MIQHEKNKELIAKHLNGEEVEYRPRGEVGQENWGTKLPPKKYVVIFLKTWPNGALGCYSELYYDNEKELAEARKRQIENNKGKDIIEVWLVEV